MFNLSSIVACNNKAFEARTILSMEDDKQMHATMVRLMYGASQAAGLTSKAEVARRLNISGQTIQNWQARGVSETGMLDAQEFLGINATWIRNGVGSTLHPGNVTCSPATETAAVYNLPTQTAKPTVGSALEVLATAMQRAGDLDMVQVRALMGALVEDPARAPDIIPRLCELLNDEIRTGAGGNTAAA